ncbi:MAG: hypothetical protein MUO26_11640 [Methanotrichaceae archaeon]|nr:hypothetical protein [Methanotrichaceae archaeon]
MQDQKNTAAGLKFDPYQILHNRLPAILTGKDMKSVIRAGISPFRKAWGRIVTEKAQSLIDDY